MSKQPRLRVLLAEDDPAVRAALAELIAGESTLELVGAVADATEAIALAAAEQPDVVLVDVRMPGGGGVAAARGISRRSPNSKVIALSGQGDRATVIQMLEAGVVGYLVKGGSVDGIIEAIKHAANGHGSLSLEVTGDVIQELVGQLSVRTRKRGHPSRRLETGTRGRPDLVRRQERRSDRRRGHRTRRGSTDAGRARRQPRPGVLPGQTGTATPPQPSERPGEGCAGQRGLAFITLAGESGSPGLAS